MKPFTSLYSPLHLQQGRHPGCRFTTSGNTCSVPTTVAEELPVDPQCEDRSCSDRTHMLPFLRLVRPPLLQLCMAVVMAAWLPRVIGARMYAVVARSLFNESFFDQTQAVLFMLTPLLLINLYNRSLNLKRNLFRIQRIVLSTGFSGKKNQSHIACTVHILHK